MSSAANIPSSCCGRTDGGICKCAAEATCSCGAKPAMMCNCEKASTENTLAGKDSCACGRREKGSCTCNRAAMENESKSYPGETDFTTKSSGA